MSLRSGALSHVLLSQWLVIGPLIAVAAALMAVVIFAMPPKPRTGAVEQVAAIAPPAESPSESPAVTDVELAPPLDGFASLAGSTWHSELDGAATRVIFEAVLGGAFVRSTSLSESGGEWQARYETVYEPDPDDPAAVIARGYSAAGEISEMAIEMVADEASGPPIQRSRWTLETAEDLVEVRQDIAPAADGESYVLRVWTSPLGREDWQLQGEQVFERID